MDDITFHSFFIAFFLTLLAGLSTSIGALMAFFSSAKNYKILSIGMGFSAGVMIYISFDELLPAARVYGNEHTAILGISLGMAIIAVSLIAFKLV